MYILKINRTTNLVEGIVAYKVEPELASIIVDQTNQHMESINAPYFLEDAETILHNHERSKINEP